MRIAVYGGSFNPPHLGHRSAAETVCRELKPDKFLIIPDRIPPHKEMAPNSPTPEARMELCKLNFSDIPGVEISDIELKREGKSYTAHTIETLRETYPDDELVLVVGTDMFLSFEEWYRYEYLFSSCSIAVLSRDEENQLKLKDEAERFRREYGANIYILPHEPLPMSSMEIREKLRIRQGREELKDDVYWNLIKNNYYEASPEIQWLREKAFEYLKPSRIAHVAGCESEAVMLAMKWGEDPETAAEAGILHDITKRLSYDEQLKLCDKYGIILDNTELSSPALLHERTGAEFAKELFGISQQVYDAIRWHTTGKPDMTLLEKIIYLADVIEPSRDFPGVDKLRELSYTDINAAMAYGLHSSIEEVKRQGRIPHENSEAAYLWYAANK